MSDFVQDAPRAPNRFRTDRALRLTLERLLPRDVFEHASIGLHRMGERTVAEIPALADRAEGNPPKLVTYDAWGKRVDRIEVDPAF